MTSQQSEQTNFGQFLSSLNVAQKLVIQIQRTPNDNGTFDISVLNNSAEADRSEPLRGPDPLRVPEVIIVISVLLLWCGSIFMFIRHSELLRIRHRDLPFQSDVKTPIDLTHVTVVNHTSDILGHSKSRVSSLGGFTPPTHKGTINGYKHDETIETISSLIPPISKKRQHTRSFDFNTSLSIKDSFDTHNDKEQLLHPHRISYQIQENLLDLHHKSMLSSMRYSVSYSTNDISRRKHTDRQHLTSGKRCIQESPL